MLKETLNNVIEDLKNAVEVFSEAKEKLAPINAKIDELGELIDEVIVSFWNSYFGVSETDNLKAQVFNAYIQENVLMSRIIDVVGDISEDVCLPPSDKIVADAVYEILDNQDVTAEQLQECIEKLTIVASHITE